MTSRTLEKIFLLDADTGWVVKEAGALLATTDAGVTWVQQKSGTSAMLTGARFVDKKTGWALG